MICLLQFYVHCPFCPILSVLSGLSVMTNSMSVLFYFLSYFLSVLSVMTNSMSVLPVFVLFLSVSVFVFLSSGQNGQ